MRRLLSVGLAAISCAAAAPVIRDISPRVAHPGKSFQLVLKGADLLPGSTLQTTLPANISRLAPAADLMRPGSELAFLIEPKPEAQVGVYPIRLLTRDGQSNVALISVDDLPSVEEAESANPKQTNNDIRSAQPLSVPGAVTGKLAEGDVDVYSIAVKAGQRLVIEVDARSIASAIDPTLEVLDGAGKVIARNEDASGAGVDARLNHTFSKAGTYYVRVHDAKYSDQTPNHFYRLKVGSWFFAEAFFPLGWRRGESVAVEALGGNLAQPVRLNPATSSARHYVPLGVQGSKSLPQMFVLSDQPEILEPAGEVKPLKAGTIVNGRIGAKGEVDRYKLAVNPGEEWMFEVTASSLGTSRLDAILTVYDGAGKKLATRDDLGSADPALPLTVPESVQEIVVSVEDLLGRGGPDYGYRLEARKGPADFTLRLATPYVNVPVGGTVLVAVDVQRRGYDGALRLRIPNLPKGFSQAGGYVAASAAQQRFDDPNPRFNIVRSTISITADADAPPQPVNLKVTGVAETEHGRIERIADGPGVLIGVKGLRQKSVTAEWLEMGLPMATAQAVPVRIVTGVPLVRISQGVEYPIRWKVERGPGVVMKGRLRENIASSVGNLRILQGEPQKSPDQVVQLVNTNFATPVSSFDFYVTGTFEVDGKTFDVTSPIVTFDIASGYQVRPAKSVWTTASGSPVQIAGAIYREPTFEGGLVRLEAQDLPEGVTCGAVEVPADSREFRLACQTTAQAPKGEHAIRLASSAPDTGRRAKDTYKGPETTVKLRIQ